MQYTNIKHNKKRNVGLLYEWLTSYVTELVAIHDDGDLADLCVEMMVRYFDLNTELGKELRAIRSLSERRYSSEDRLLGVQAIADFKKTIKEVDLFQSNIEKSNLIKEVNHTISKDLYSRETDDYRLHASIYGLIESVKRGDAAEEARYESMVLSNLVEDKDEAVVVEGPEDGLSDDEKSLIRTNKFLSEMGDRLRNKLDNLTNDQNVVLENWDAWHRGQMDSALYRAFLMKKLDKVLEHIDSIVGSDEDSPSMAVLTGLREVYVPSAVEDMPEDALTEHILEGLGMERFR